MSDAYLDFLRSKIPQAEVCGFEPLSEPHPSLFPHQVDIARWMCRGGRRACFASFGMGKTRIDLQLAQWVTEKTGGRFLIIAPLGVRQEFTLSDGPSMGLTVEYVRDDVEVQAATSRILITNYERVRDGGIDLDQFDGVSMDEASVLRSFGSKTYQSAIRWGRTVKYRFVFTATPSPNRYKELIHYSAFLGVMDSGDALTRFFQRDSEEANNLTLYPHMEATFWAWMSSWAVFLQKPSDLGYSDEGYDMPPMQVHWHRVAVDHTKAWSQVDSWGQAQLFQDEAEGLAQSAKAKRESLTLRINKVFELLTDDTGTIGIPKGILREESSLATPEAAGAECGALPGEQGEPQRSLETLGRHESGTHEGAEAKARGCEPGETDSKIPGVLSSQPAGMPQEESNPETQEGLRDHTRAVRGDGDGAVGPVFDMWEEAGSRPKAVCRSLSRLEQGTRPALHAVQLRHRTAQGRSGYSAEGGKVSFQCVIWCDLNDEQDHIESALKRIGVSFCSLRGSQDIDTREELVAAWKARETCVFLSKPSMYGAGVNLQQASTMFFVGVGYKFQEFIQGIHRIFRFQQKHTVNIHIVHLESEDAIVAALKAKWSRHVELMATMSELLRKNRLSNLSAMELTRSLGCTRAEVKSDRFTAINNDCVMETRAMPDNSVDMVLTSIPFGNQYEYSPSYNDFGHNVDNGAFFQQMGFLCPELLRILRPGRIAAIHVKDRIRFGNVTGDGFPTVDPFSDHAVTAFCKAGFRLMARITIDTDVVRENNQTYRLGWSENAKDSSKMGAGMPEYVLVFRKLPSDTSDGYADIQVKKSKAEYTRADWQIDAAGIWRSSGNRLPDIEVLRHASHPDIIAAWKKHCLSGVYSHEEHVAVAKRLEDASHLPATFMLFAAVSRNADIWSDISRMLTLNSRQAQGGREKHVCPLQLDIIKRLITRYTNPGEVVFDPFMGIGSTGWQAIKMGRHALGTELNTDYWADSVGYMEMAEREVDVPTLFDLAAAGAVKIGEAV